MTDERVRWGVLGCASDRHRKVIPAMQESSSLDVIAIASRSANGRPRRPPGLGIPRRYGSYDDFSPTRRRGRLHPPSRPPSRRVDAAGRRRRQHVLCKKPLGMTGRGDRIIDGCRAAGVALIEAFMYRLHPLSAARPRARGRRRIGELETIQAFFSYRNVDPANIRNIAAYGGGALMDIGSYPINVARWMFDGEPTGRHWHPCAATRRSAPTSSPQRSSTSPAPGDVHVLDADRGRPRVHLVGTSAGCSSPIPFNSHRTARPSDPGRWR